MNVYIYIKSLQLGNVRVGEARNPIDDETQTPKHRDGLHEKQN